MVTKPWKTLYQWRYLGSQIKEETSPSKEATSSISYQQLVSRHGPGAYSNKYNSIK